MTRVFAVGLLLLAVAAAAIVVRSRGTAAHDGADGRVTSAANSARLERVMAALASVPRPEPEHDDAHAAGATGAAPASPDGLAAELLGASRPLRPDDRDLLEPDGHSETGELVAGDGGAPAPSRHRYSVRLKRRTIPPGEPLEAIVDVSTPEGRSVAFQVRKVETRTTESGQVDPAGTWAATPNERGQLIVWSPPGLAPDSGRRNLELELEVGGETRTLTAMFTIAWPPPVRATETVRTTEDDAFLRVEVRFAAKSTWSCQLSANLFDGAGRPLQHTTWLGAVTDGTWVPFEFSRALLDLTADEQPRLSLRDIEGTCRSSGDEGAVVARIETISTAYPLPPVDSSGTSG